MVKLKIATKKNLYVNVSLCERQVATFIPPGHSSRPTAAVTSLHNDERRQQILPFTESSLILNGTIKS